MPGRVRPRITVALVALALTAGAVAAAGGCGRGGPQGEQSRGQALAGVQMHPFWDGATPREAARELAVAKRAGARVVRVDVGWSSLELSGKGRVSHHYARRIAAFLRNAERHDIEVIATLHQTPCWASAAPESLRRGCRGQWWERGVETYPPRRARDYGDAAAYVARRWGDRLLALELWNEPNAEAFLKAPDRVMAYSRLVRAAYRPVKRANRGLIVLAGSILRSDGEFVRGMFERGRIRGHYDAISYHPYTGDPTAEEHPRGAEYSLIAGTRWLHEIVRAHGDADGELWATEAGASTCDPDQNDHCVSRADQAAEVASYIKVARRFPYLRAMIIYNLRDKGTDPGDIEDNYGLVRSNLRAKPSFHAFRRAAGANR